MSLPSGSLRTSGGVLLARCGPGVGDAEPSRGVHRAVVIEERDPGVVGLHVLRHAAVRHDDDAAIGIVRAALGGIDRAVDLDVRRHRIELAVRRGVDRQAQRVAQHVRLRLLLSWRRRRRGRLGRLGRLLSVQRSGDHHRAAKRESKSSHHRFSESPASRLCHAAWLACCPLACWPAGLLACWPVAPQYSANARNNTD